MENTSCCSNRVCTKCEVISHEQVAPEIMVLTCREPVIASQTQPGQFINIACADSRSYDPLLRRPFSVYRADQENGVFSVLYVLRGRGTMFLRERKPGDIIDCVGPLGHGFEIQPADAHLLVAGGCGAAPLALLAERLRKEQPRSEIIALLGAQTALGVVCESDFALSGINCDISTEDASRGREGLVTDTLSNRLETLAGKKTVVYACGPTPMLKAVHQIAENHGVECQVSMETFMACGVGVCMGCALKIKDPNSQTGYSYQRCCTEGPVFDSRKVWWE